MSNNVTVQTAEQLANEYAAADRSQPFEELRAIFADLRSQIDERFELNMDESSKDLQPYEAPGGQARGFMSNFSGKEIDWLVDSWIGRPETGFANAHLTIWLPPTTRVPHLAYALATFPDRIFFYMDFVPRVDMSMNVDYLDKYYQSTNELTVKFQNNPEMNWFYSRSLYVREALSVNSLCFTCKYTDENMAEIRNAAETMYSQWVAWLDEGDPVPQSEQAAQAERDLYFRRTIAERDPANSLGEQMFGKEFTDRLVRCLWGGDRQLPRPGVDA